MFKHKTGYFFSGDFMKQKILGFHQDRQGDWVAELACGHTQHMRHDPPMSVRPWIISAEGRENFIGTELNCQRCENSNEDDLTLRSSRVATAVKAACLQEAIAAYQLGKLSGLCQEGAWDLALDAIRSLDVGKVLETLPDGD